MLRNVIDIAKNLVKNTNNVNKHNGFLSMIHKTLNLNISLKKTTTKKTVFDSELDWLCNDTSLKSLLWVYRSAQTD